jgi:hypothetical protein
MTRICALCGNDAEMADLRWSGDSLVHKDACPPRRAGLGTCTECWTAQPESDLLDGEEVWAIKWDEGTANFANGTGSKKAIPAGSTPPSRCVRVGPADISADEFWTSIPEGTAGIIVSLTFEEPGYRQPIRVCRACAARLGWTGQRGARPSRYAAVPDSGRGIPLEELAELWGVHNRRARDLAAEGVESGELEVTEQAGGRGSPQKFYRRAAR